MSCPNIKMIVIFLQLLFSYTWGLRTNNADFTKLIVGGEPVDKPYMVSVLKCGSHVCGGSILSENYILTAAHCINNAYAWTYSIRAGSSIINEGGEIKTLSDIYVHPNYNDSLDYDIAIFLLKSPLIYRDGVIKPVKLVAANIIIPSGTEAVVSGWGLTEEDGSQSTQLLGVTVPVVSNTICQEVYGAITERMLCAGNETGGGDACSSDSGGPLVSSEYGQIGIVSWGSGCGRPGLYGVYANVSNMRPWISSITGI